jgi:hypothetical protein
MHKTGPHVPQPPVPRDRTIRRHILPYIQVNAAILQFPPSFPHCSGLT